MEMKRLDTCKLHMTIAFRERKCGKFPLFLFRIVAKNFEACVENYESELMTN